MSEEVKPTPTEEQVAGNKLFVAMHELIKDLNWMDAMSVLSNFQGLIFNATIKEQQERELATLRLDVPEEVEFAKVKELMALFAEYSIGDANKYSQAMLNGIELHTKLLIKEKTIANLEIKLPGDVETPKE